MTERPDDDPLARIRRVQAADAKAKTKAGAIGNGQDKRPPPRLDPRDPMAMARTLVERELSTDGRCSCRHYRGVFHHWNGSRYLECDEATMRADAWRFLDRAVVRVKPKAGPPADLPFKPSPRQVSAVVDALGAVTHLASELEPPAWLDADQRHAAADILPVGNGLLHLPSGLLLPATPGFFALHGTSVRFEPHAVAPQWLAFLGQIFSADAEAIETLQDWFGYCLTPSTRQQKILMMIGPTRSGKGTTATLLGHIVGRDTVAAPTLSSMTTNFGLAPLIGKSLAVVSDARLGSRTDQAQVAERLLSISGEDSLTVDRKHRPAWTGRLPTRFMVLTNELPRIADASSALAKRFLMLPLKHSFYGREDPGLTDKLLAEAPGILNWARVGDLRLRRRGHFVQPASGRKAIEEMETLASPVRAYGRDRCTIEAGAKTHFNEIYLDWKQWCDENGGQRPGPRNMFSRDLCTAFPGVEVDRSRVPGLPRQRYCFGLKLGQSEDE